MAADAGAQEIYDLLNQEEPFLNQELAKVVKAAKNARKNPYGVMAQKGVDALAEVRQYYRILRSRIAEIETVDQASKTSALQSLDALDTALDAWEAGLDFGISRPALPKLKNAERNAGRAKRKIKGTIAGLSR
jgi:hypothetical protein